MTESKLPNGGPWDPETPPTRANVLLPAPCVDCGGTGAENGVTGKGACSTCKGTGRRQPTLSADAHVLPDRIAVDANGFGWRVWNGSDYWSMVPSNPDNSPIPHPVTWYLPALEPKDAEVRAAATAITVNGYERLMELVRPEDRREAIACLLGVVRAVASDLATQGGER